MRGSKGDFPITIESEKMVIQEKEWEDLHVAFITHKERSEMASIPGLPEGRCQCPHWGYVIKGSMRVCYKDHEEEIHEGDVFYLPAGHLVAMEAGTEVVQFSSKELMQKTKEAVQQIMQERKEKEKHE